MPDPSALTTFLFTDIEGSTELWEREPGRMQAALAAHDAIARASAEREHGRVVKMTGDGMNAAFGDPLDALKAALRMQHALADPSTTAGIALRARCALHVGVVEHRDDDYFGQAMNRAARLMAAAHGEQILVSQAVALLIGERLPQDVTLRDLGRVRLRDLGTAEHVYQVVDPGLRSGFPAPRTLEAVPNNLPQQITSFVGREHELAEAHELLRRNRLLTLVGAGGLGKTRLSLHIGADAIDEFPDGVWFVELAPLTDPERVQQAVATVLGVKEDAGHPIVDALAKHVRDRRMLLVLDNCEHVLGACAELARQLLRTSAELRILASSREPLRVAGEALYPVPALAVPGLDDPLGLEALAQCDAVRLFADRAVAAHPAFDVTAQNASAVSTICRRLDGIPLAIELAAARVRALSVEKIAERLSDRFRLLTGGDRTAMPRQQTLRASIDWSYDLLVGEEQVVLRRLAVFAGGWTLEAAEAVCAGGAIDEGAILDILSRLVEKSLVEMETDATRYRLLETVRQYAQERLDESGEGDAVRDRHLGFFVDLVEKARPELGGPDQAAWLGRLDLERENILSAHMWCDRAADGARLGLKLAHSIKLYCLNRGLMGLLHRVSAEALARAGAQERTLERCRGLFNAGQVCCFTARYREASGYLQESLAIARELGDDARIAAALQLLGMASLGLGDTLTARAYLDEGLDHATTLGNKRYMAAALNGVAQLHRMGGALDAAEPLYQRTLELARELGDREITAVALLNLAMVAIGQGAAPRARAPLLEVLAIAEDIGSRPAGRSAFEVSAALASLSGEWKRAARFFGMAEVQIELTGLHRDPADDAFLKPLVARAREALGDDAFVSAEAGGRTLAYATAMAEVRAWLERDR